MNNVTTICFALCLATATVAVLAEEQPLQSGLPPGSYTGAGQIMEINADGKPTYGDNLGICHIELKPNGHLIAEFPLVTTNGATHFKTVFLDLKTVEPRATWSAAYKDGAFYKATAIPFSAEQYVFRLEVFRKRRLVAGAQQFYSFCALSQPKGTR